jgi:small GTP-binding protein
MEVTSNDHQDTGVTLRHTLRGHTGWINRIAWSRNGRMLASASNDRTVRVWDAETGQQHCSFTEHQAVVLGVAWSKNNQILASSSGDRPHGDNTIRLWDVRRDRGLRTLSGHTDWVNAVAWSPHDDHLLASASADRTVRLWNAATGELFRTLPGHTANIFGLAWSPDGQTLASASADRTIRLWKPQTGEMLLMFGGHSEDILSVDWSPDGHTLASGSLDRTIRIWDANSGRQLICLERHTGHVRCVAFSSDGRLLASKAGDGTVRICRCGTWELAAEIPEPHAEAWLVGTAFHPSSPVLATLGDGDTTVRIWNLEPNALLGRPPAKQSVHHTTAKVVLVGDSGVGKTSLGWHLAKGEFKEHPATHGQNFWTLDRLHTEREDGTECEAVLWDLGGQRDYRLIHALHLDDADLALVLFDPSDWQDPLRGVEYWLKALSHRKKPCETILVGARLDIGSPNLASERIEAFCKKWKIGGGYAGTSALTGQGLNELLALMKERINWEAVTPIMTTALFKRIKQYVLQLKEESDRSGILVSPAGLRQRLHELEPGWEFSDEEMMTAVEHLSRYGYARVLRTAANEKTILLAPELLNNLAASFVLEARRNPQGLGALDERGVLNRQYDFPELRGLSEAEQDVLLDAVTVLFLEHNICCRGTLGTRTFLIFPELINQRKPPIPDELPREDDVSYTLLGSVENLYAALAVLLSYTNVFTRADQWQDQVEYEVGPGEVCGIRKLAEREGEVDLVLYYGKNVLPATRNLFQGLVERFLSIRQVTVTRFPPLVCPKLSCNYRQERAVVVRRVRKGESFLHCSNCGKKIPLPGALGEVIFGQEVPALVDREQAEAHLRTEFEAALAWLKGVVRDRGKGTEPLNCFISYAWGVEDHVGWVRTTLATDLRNAGLAVILDDWDAQIGTDLPRFISQIPRCDRIVVVGTQLYQQKYENGLSRKGSVVAAEVDLINQRLLGTENQKRTVLPVLLAGDAETSLPPLMQLKVFADFRRDEDYFATLFDLILTVYEIPFGDPGVADLRQSLRPPQPISSGPAA